MKNVVRNMLRYGFVLNILMVLTITGCGEKKVSSATYENVQPAAVKQLVDEGRQVLILDVRTPGEFTGELGHIKGARLHPVQDISSWAPEFNSYKDKEIITVCRTGHRSGIAAKYLAEHGFQKVKNMTGGMTEWNSLGFPIEKGTDGQEGK